MIGTPPAGTALHPGTEGPQTEGHFIPGDADKVRGPLSEKGCVILILVYASRKVTALHCSVQAGMATELPRWQEPRNMSRGIWRRGVLHG